MGDRFFRWLLRLFPADFRGDFGSQMQEDFRDERQDAGSASATLGVWARNLMAFGRLGLRLHLEQLAQDLRYAVRNLRTAAPATIMSVLALGYAIGSATITFAIADAFFFKPMPYADPEGLVHIWGADQRRGFSTLRVSRQEYDAFAARTDLFAGVAAFNYTSEEVTGPGSPERVPSGRVSANVFDVLGVRPVVGRTFHTGEDLAGRPGTVIISHRYWQTRFAGRSDVLGQDVQISGVPHEVIGVMPADTAFPLPTTDLWLTRVLDPQRYTPAVRSLQVVARLAPGVTRSAAAQALASTSADLSRQYAELAGRTTNIASLRRALNFAYDIFVIGALVSGIANFIVLLTAAANVSSLMLGRAVRRTREVAVRAALGASRFRLIRQFLAESLVLGLAGAGVGIALAFWVIPLLNTLIPTELYKVGAFVVDGRVLAIAVGLAIVSALLFGLTPALRFAQVNLSGAMRRDGGAGTTSRDSLRLQQRLVVQQVALSLVLLIAMTLVHRSASALADVDPGFNPEPVLTVLAVLPRARYESADSARAFQAAVLDRTSRLPGVAAAAFVSYLPLNHEREEVEFTRPGQAPASGATPAAQALTVSADYFHVLSIPVRAGRTFTEDDREGREPVVVINETMARRHWGDTSPLGSTISLDDASTSYTIVGVVSDTAQYDLATGPDEQVFLAMAQQPWYSARLLVRGAVEPASLIGAVTAAIHTVDPGLPLVEVRPLAEVVDEFLLPYRALRLVLVVLGGVSLALALFGVYSTISCFVAERTRELGIRVALGADPGQIARLVISRATRLVWRGMAYGLPLAIAAGWFMRGFLFGVSAANALLYALILALVAGVGAAAAWAPARRASHVDPLIAIRVD